MTKQEYKTTDKITEEVIKEVLEVEQEQGLTASNLVEKAKDKNSILHDLFDWDDTIAAEKWRLQQARALINEIKIVVGDKTMYAFENVNVSVTDASEREYKPVMEIISNEQYRNQILKSALNFLNSWKMKYKQFTELKPIVVSIERTTKHLERKWLKNKK